MADFVYCEFIDPVAEGREESVNDVQHHERQVELPAQGMRVFADHVNHEEEPGYGVDTHRKGIALVEHPIGSTYRHHYAEDENG